MTGGENEWDPDRYDDAHSFVYEYGASLLDRLGVGPGDRVLDLGCGTGHLTARVAETGADAVGLDADAGMVNRARERHPGPSFVHADARGFDCGRFDAVVSNAMLHWVPEPDHDDVLDGVHGSLVPGGRFVAELGGVGNVGAIVEAVEAELEARGHPAECPWHFPSIGTYTPRLERAGFEVRDARLFDRPTTLSEGADGLVGWLETFADGYLGALSPTEREAVLEAVEERLRPVLFEDGVWTADYRRLRFVAVA